MAGSASATDLGTLWTLTKDTRTTTCRATTHPLGMELRLMIDRDLVSTGVFKDADGLFKQAEVWREKFEAKGWRLTGEWNEHDQTH